MQHPIKLISHMLSQPISVTFDIGGGREVTIETGKLARQADGSVTVRQGNCILLATVVANKEPKEGQDFFPLSVDYQEKFASAGRIPGSFFKRRVDAGIRRMIGGRERENCVMPNRSPTECQKHNFLTHKWLSFFGGQ